VDGSLAANKHKEFVNSYVVIILSMAQNYANIISRKAKIERFASQILIVSSKESNSLALTKERINNVIQSCLQDYGSMSGSGGIRGNIKLLSGTQHEENVFVNVDKDRLSQVISSLLSDAIKFTRGGDIGISVKRKRKAETQGLLLR
jgi:signal transduction histidine kinase